jgi:hypothetical protein
MAYTTAQLVAAYTAADGVRLNEATRSALAALAARTQSGELSDAAALALVIARTEITTPVVGEILRFFNDRPPRRIDVSEVAEAIAAKVRMGSSPENQLIGFAAELGLGQGRRDFAAAYGALDFPAFVAAAYERLIGAEAARAAGYDAAAAVADTVGRAEGFAGLLRDRGLLRGGTAEDGALAIKAATVGYLLCEAIKWEFGACVQRANDHALALIAGEA